jgi:hypothetical protein
MFGMFAFGQPFFADGPGATPAPPVVTVQSDEKIHLGIRESLGVDTRDPTIGGW